MHGEFHVRSKDAARPRVTHDLRVVRSPARPATAAAWLSMHEACTAQRADLLEVNRTARCISIVRSDRTSRGEILEPAPDLGDSRHRTDGSLCTASVFHWRRLRAVA